MGQQHDNRFIVLQNRANIAAVVSCENTIYLHSKVAEHFENCCKKLRSGPTEMNINEISNF